MNRTLFLCLVICLIPLGDSRRICKPLIWFKIDDCNYCQCIENGDGYKCGNYCESPEKEAIENGGYIFVEPKTEDYDEDEDQN